MASEIRVNKITHTAGVGTITTNVDGIIVAGIVTANSFSGNISGTTGTFTGNLGVGGVLTYEDVTNIDSVGVITARAGVNVSSGSSIGIGTDKPSASLYVHESNISQGFTPHTDTAICAESSTNANIEIATGHNSTGAIFFSDTGAQGKGKIQYLHGSGGDLMTFQTNGSEKLRITSDGKVGINESNPDTMLHLKGGVPAITLEDTDGTHGQAIIEQNGDTLKIRQDAGNSSSGTGSVIQFEVDAQAYAKVDTAFGLKADNTCKAWLVYRSEAGNEGIIDDFNVSTVNDEGTGTFGVTLSQNVHRHGNGFSQSIVFGSYNASSYPFVASVGYAPSHGSNNPWWDVEDNFVRVQTQRSDTGAILDAKVFSMAMFGDTGDLYPT